MLKSLEIVNVRLSLFKKDKIGFVAICYVELEQIKQDLEDYQRLLKIHNQMREEMEREQKAHLELAEKNLERDMMIDYSYCMGRASCYRDLLDYYDEDWVKENVR